MPDEEDDEEYSHIYVLSIDSDFHEILHFLCNFGYFIIEFELHHFKFGDVKRLEILTNYIEKYVASYVSEVHLMLGHGSLNLIGPYPNAERLGIRYESDGDLTYPEEYNNAIELFQKTFELNPQIRHLTIETHCTWNALKMSTNYLPNLESLQAHDVHYYSNFFVEESNEFFNNGYNGEPIEFKNVKKFDFLEFRSIDYIPTEFLEQNPLAFGNLDEINFFGRHGIENWVQMMLKNPNLRSVKIPNAEFNDDQLLRMADGLLKLEELYMTYSTLDLQNIDGVVQFMKKASQLNIASFYRVKSQRCKAIAEQLIFWKIHVNDGFLCEFVRS